MLAVRELEEFRTQREKHEQVVNMACYLKVFIIFL